MSRAELVCFKKTFHIKLPKRDTRALLRGFFSVCTPLNVRWLGQRGQLEPALHYTLVSGEDDGMGRERESMLTAWEVECTRGGTCTAFISVLE